MAGYEQYLTALLRLCELMRMLLQLAREERWDELLELAEQQPRLLHELEQYSIDQASLEEAERSRLLACFNELVLLNQEVMARSRAWQGEVAKIIQDVGSSRATSHKLQRAYR